MRNRNADRAWLLRARPSSSRVWVAAGVSSAELLANCTVRLTEGALGSAPAVAAPAGAAGGAPGEVMTGAGRVPGEAAGVAARGSAVWTLGLAAAGDSD